MNLLITTQAVDSNDSNLGFFHRWIEEFAKHCEKVTVICLREGKHSFPANVEVLSLGKEHNTSRLKRIRLFYKYIFARKNDYDAVFVHMNPEYLVLGGYFWKRWGKPTSLWYAHRSDTRRLRLAVRWVDHVLSVSQNSFAVPTPKLVAMGHGIDTDLFRPQIRHGSIQLRIVTVGRVAASKHLREMFGVLEELHARDEQFAFTIVGSPVTPEEEQYATKITQEIATALWRSEVVFLGPLRHDQLPQMLNSEDVFFNFATTGNMDKAGLEALASGVPLLSTNPAFEPLLSPYGLYVPSMHPKEVADALIAFLARPDQPAILATLRNKVVAEHSLSSLVPRILQILQS